jgi:hypothetical protein
MAAQSEKKDMIMEGREKGQTMIMEGREKGHDHGGDGGRVRQKGACALSEHLWAYFQCHYNQPLNIIGARQVLSYLSSKPRNPLRGPDSLAALSRAFTSSLLVFFATLKTQSVMLPFVRGTRTARPLSFPLSSGNTSAMAVADPVDVGDRLVIPDLEVVETSE